MKRLFFCACFLFIIFNNFNNVVLGYGIENLLIKEQENYIKERQSLSKVTNMNKRKERFCYYIPRIELNLTKDIYYDKKNYDDNYINLGFTLYDKTKLKKIKLNQMDEDLKLINFDIEYKNKLYSILHEYFEILYTKKYIDNLKNDINIHELIYKKEFQEPINTRYKEKEYSLYIKRKEDEIEEYGNKLANMIEKFKKKYRIKDNFIFPEFTEQLYSLNNKFIFNYDAKKTLNNYLSSDPVLKYENFVLKKYEIDTPSDNIIDNLDVAIEVNYDLTSGSLNQIKLSFSIHDFALANNINISSYSYTDVQKTHANLKLDNKKQYSDYRIDRVKEQREKLNEINSNSFDKITNKINTIRKIYDELEYIYNNGLIYEEKLDYFLKKNKVSKEDLISLKNEMIGNKLSLLEKTINYNYEIFTFQIQYLNQISFNNFELSLN